MIHDRRARARSGGQIRVSRGGRAADEHLKVAFFGVWSVDCGSVVWVFLSIFNFEDCWLKVSGGLRYTTLDVNPDGSG